MAGEIYSYSVKGIDGTQKPMSSFQGKAMLIVNVASKCGFTPQYTGLEELYKKFKDRGLVILGFPCNQFGGQEPGSESEIQQFCELNFGVSFPLFAKIDVNGEKADPLFQYLKKAEPGILGTEGIKWNFTKFLVSKDGKVLKRYAPTVKPDELDKDIQAALN